MVPTTLYACSTISGGGSCGVLEKYNSAKIFQIYPTMNVLLKCTENSRYMIRNKNDHDESHLTRTLVVNGVSETKDSNNEGNQGLARGVLSVEPPSFDTANCGLGRWALGQLGVKVHEMGEACSRTGRLQRLR